LDQIATGAEQARLARERQQPAALPPAPPIIAALPVPIPSIEEILPERYFKPFPPVNALPKALPVPAYSIPEVELDARWRDVILPPAVVMVLGKRGSGKSALAYRVLDLFRHRLTPYVVGVPSSARQLLPEWIGIVSTLEELPNRCIALVDEAYLACHARESMAQESKAMCQILNLSRQREQTLIFVAQEARQVDKNIASAASVLVFKELGMLQPEFERPELKKLVASAGEALSGRSWDRRKWAYVYSPDTDFLGLLESPLASFWKPSLSRLFATEQAPSRPRPARQLTAQEKAQMARELRVQGLSYHQIAQRLGVSKSTVVNYLRNYPYRD
jgi:DNA-binding CsgD family transcriptional regulator